MPYLDEDGVAHMGTSSVPEPPHTERQVALHALVITYVNNARHPDPTVLEAAERTYLRFARQCFPET